MGIMENGSYYVIIGYVCVRVYIYIHIYVGVATIFLMASVAQYHGSNIASSTTITEMMCNVDP